MLPFLPALLVAASLLGTPDGGSDERVLLDRIVAVVDRQPILWSDLAFEARVALIRQGGLEAARAQLSEPELAVAFDYVLGQRLALAEADRLKVFPVDDAEVAQEVRQFSRHFPSELEYRRFLRSCEVPEEQLAALLRRDLRVARFLDSKVRRSAQLSEEDLKRYFDARPGEFSGRSFAQARETIRGQLLRERYRGLAAEQLKALRDRADVRLLVRLRENDTPDGGAARP